MPQSGSYYVRSLGRGLEILAMLAEARNGVGVSEVATALSIDKSTAFRLLSTLVDEGFAVQDEDRGRYRAGMRIVQLSARVLDRTELREVAVPWVKRLQTLTGESAHLAVLAQGKAVYIHKETAGSGLNVNTEVGRQAPLHCSAIGKALIAELPPAELNDILSAQEMTKYTPRTMTTLRELAPHLEVTHSQGYAVDDEEFEPGVRCVAAAIRGHSGRVEAAVGVSGPSMRVTLERIPALGAMAAETALEISRLLGYGPAAQCAS